MMRKVLVLIGILGGVVPVVAQVAQPALYEEAIVVTASLDDERKSDLPAAVSVIESEEIEYRQSTEVASLLASLPAMTVVQSGSPGQVTSLFTRGTKSDQTLVLWNGVELNDPYFGGFNWAFMPTEGVGRVEAVRGPFSSLYGGDAVGGGGTDPLGSPEWDRSSAGGRRERILARPGQCVDEPRTNACRGGRAPAAWKRSGRQ